ncbi:MAG: HlyD family efflux transporter periplasmic adaptor subunit, partial [Planctomycetales bacterium]|nr:HlyD family efflux transporter periplasmic adaptor subunit [Planctomycetales bacterium]
VDKSALEIEHAQHEIDVATISQRRAENALQAIEHQLELHQIRAQITGFVDLVVTQPGEWVKAGQSIFRVLRTDRLYAEGFLPAERARADLNGREVTVVVEDNTGHAESFPGIIRYVRPQIDVNSAEVRVRAEIEDPDRRLRAGTTAVMRVSNP